MKIRWWHLLVIALLVVTFILLALWQWGRFRSGSGSFQNLGYAFQWPLFAAFVIYAYFSAIRHENDRLEFLEENGDAEAYELDREKDKGKMKKIDESFMPARPQLSVEEFNDLNRQTRGGQDAGPGA